MPLITVINDDTAFLRLMQELLRSEGYEVDLHIEGASAHTRVKQSKPDLIILDIRLEHAETGWMVLDLLRLDPQTRDIPVIISSADSGTLREKESMLRRQGYEVLEKPFDLNTLLEIIQSRIGQPKK